MVPDKACGLQFFLCHLSAQGRAGGQFKLWNFCWKMGFAMWSMWACLTYIFVAFLDQHDNVKTIILAKKNLKIRQVVSVVSFIAWKHLISCTCLKRHVLWNCRSIQAKYQTRKQTQISLLFKSPRGSWTHFSCWQQKSNVLNFFRMCLTASNVRNQRRTHF